MISSNDDLLAKLFKKVNEELGLESTSDWGIINSDSNRVVEFIEYIKINKDLPSQIHFEFLELIIASMNDAILERKNDQRLQKDFLDYIEPLINDANFYPHIPYWISIKNKEEFPIGFLLEKLKAESGGMKNL